MTWCRRFVAAAKMGAEIIPGLLESIRKATSERREYGKGKKAARWVWRGGGCSYSFANVGKWQRHG